MPDRNACISRPAVLESVDVFSITFIGRFAGVDWCRGEAVSRDICCRIVDGRTHFVYAGLGTSGSIFQSPDASGSPAFKIDRLDCVKTVQKDSGEKKPIRIYIDNGGVGLETRLQPGVDEMLTALNEKGYIQDQDYYWVKDLTAEHNESAWAKHLPNALIRMFAQ